MIHICTGGPVYRMLLREEIVYFEDHQWCGPTLLNKRGDPARVQPALFLTRASQWAQQGRRLNGDLAVFDPAIPLK